MQNPEGVGWVGAKSCREVGCCRKVRPWNGGGGIDWVSVEEGGLRGTAESEGGAEGVVS